MLDRQVRRLSRMRNPVEWRIARILDRLDGGSGYLELGFVRLSDYASERLGLPPRRVQTLLALARGLAPLHQVAVAFESGVLSQSQAALLGRVATADDEMGWVARAASSTVRRLARDVRDVLAARTDAARAIVCDADEPGEPGETLRFSAPARLRPLWGEALELARRCSGSSDPIHQCVEFIAADFLSGAPPVQTFDDDDCPGGADGTDLFEEADSAIEAETRRPDGSAETDGLAEACGSAGTDGVADTDRPVTALPEEALDRPEDTPRILDQRLRALIALRQDLAWRQGRVLRMMADRRLYRDLGFISFSRYCRERAGLGVRRAWQLLALDRRLEFLPRLAEAYRTGRLSWVRSSAVARVATGTTEAEWIRLAQSVTVRRLLDEVAVALAARDAGSDLAAGGVLPPGLGPDGRVQLSAPCAAGAASKPSEVPDRGGRAHISFWAPLGVISLWRQALAASRLILLREWGSEATGPEANLSEPAEWECVERVLQTFVAGWSIRQTPAWRRRYRIFERDGWRCRVPGCTSRRNLQVHHVVFRSHGGGEDDANLAALCATHHLRGLHLGRLRCHGLPDGLLAWEFAPDAAAGPLLRFVEDVAWEAAQA